MTWPAVHEDSLQLILTFGLRGRLPAAVQASLHLEEASLLAVVTVKLESR